MRVSACTFLSVIPRSEATRNPGLIETQLSSMGNATSLRAPRCLPQVGFPLFDRQL
jgi:hypothetical protein